MVIPIGLCLGAALGAGAGLVGAVVLGGAVPVVGAELSFVIRFPPSQRIAYFAIIIVVLEFQLINTYLRRYHKSMKCYELINRQH